MDWEATDLVTAWKSFQQHTEFWFAGPLAKTAEAQKCNYLMIWIGNKGRDIYSTWDLSEDDKKKLEVQVSPLRSYSGHSIDTVGVIHLRCSYKCQDHVVKFHIVDRNVQSVVGAKTCEAMKLLKRIHSITQTSNLQETTKPFLPEKLEQQYGDLFTGLGCLPGTHKIRINKTVAPVVL
ncbi:unnamed protein product [Mytilus coruscus]|uniref:Uncharacterized protein n=1 Tax=Mytilus coruscus TaxID=42192 RepID=A0A6J8AHL9_MYTCO|nr:unnamed protein product [Mytilus coruscus]